MRYISSSLSRFVIATIGFCLLQTPALAVADPEVWQKQVIYLVFPDRFRNGNDTNDRVGASNCFDQTDSKKFHGGDWAGLRQSIPYLKELGVTAIWITPVNKQVGITEDGSCGYHGYWADLTDPDDEASEAKLGSNNELMNLIMTLHERQSNFKFILDQVVNHVGYKARIRGEHPEWFNRSTACNGEVIDCELFGLPDINLSNSDAVRYVTQQSLGWLERYPVDAIRMDTAKHVPIKYFQDTWIPQANAVKPDIFLIAEVLEPGAGALRNLKRFIDAGFDSVFNFPLRQAVVDTFAKENSTNKVAELVQNTIETFGMSRSLLLVNLVDNHDVPRFINEPGFGVPEDDIRQRYHLALGAIFTLPGIPQIYYGDEIGMYGGKDPDNRRDMPTWAWTSAGREVGGSGFLPQPQTTFTYVQKLVSIRQSNPALHSGYYAELWRQNEPSKPDVYAFFRGKGDNRVIVIINNGTLPTGLLSIPIQANISIETSDRQALSNGTMLEELLKLGAPSRLTIVDSELHLGLPAKTIGIYKVSTR